MNLFDNYYNKILLEANHALDFLLNPANRNLSWKEVKANFLADGGDMLGEGAFAQVFSHPKWNYVLKIFPNDDCYLRFIRYVMKNPRDCFPKIIGAPQRIYPQFIRRLDWDHVYIVRLEKLEPLWGGDRNKMRDILQLAKDIAYFNKALVTVSDPNEETSLNENLRDSKRDIADLIQDDPSKKEFIETVLELSGKQNPIFSNCVADLHIGNVMRNASGAWIITDPFAERFTNIQNREERIRDKYNLALTSDKINVPAGKVTRAQRKHFTV